jgi:hypothetical protein
MGIENYSRKCIVISIKKRRRCVKQNGEERNKEEARDVTQDLAAVNLLFLNNEHTKSEKMLAWKKFKRLVKKEVVTTER